MSTESKVGAFTLLTIAVFSYVVIHLTGFSFGDDDKYRVQAVFSQVNGLLTGSQVRYAGVQVGSVEAIETDGRGAVVTMKIEDYVQIPKTSYITVSSDGMMGEKFVNIIPPTAGESAECLKPGEQIKAYDEQGMEKMLAAANTVLLDVQKLVGSLNGIFGNEQVKKSMIESAVNLQEMTKNLNEMTGAMSRMMSDNEQDVRLMVSRLGVMADNMANLTGRLDRMLTQMDGDGQTGENMRVMIDSLRKTSERVEHMAESLEGVVTDPQTAADLKATLSHARGVSEKANRMLGQVDALQIKSGVDVLYSGGADDYLVNADVKVYTNQHDYLMLGVDDIGEGNKTNLQLAKGGDVFTGRFGVFDNKAGLGLDTRIGRDGQFSAEAYDPDDVRVRLKAQYRLAPDIYLIGQTNDVNDSRERESYVGLRCGF